MKWEVLTNWQGNTIFILSVEMSLAVVVLFVLFGFGFWLSWNLF